MPRIFKCRNNSLYLSKGGVLLTLAPLLEHLVLAYDATNIIVEGGATTLKHVFQQQLANEVMGFYIANAIEP